MTIGFDPHNLEAAVTAVINEAADEEPAAYIDTQAKRRYDLTDRDEVRAYLMDRVRAHYARVQAHPDGVQIARIEEVVYRGIGYVFEPHLGEMHPAPIGAEGDAPRHLAVFWANLTP